MVRPYASITIHCDSEENLEFELTEIKEIKHSTGTDSKFRVLKIGDTSIFLTDEQAEQLFDVLDEKLHDTTYAQMEDDLSSLDCENEELKEEIEHLRGLLSDARVSGF